MDPRLKSLLAGIGAVALAGGALMLAAGPERTRKACAAIGLCTRPDMVATMLAAVKREQALLVLSARLVAPISAARHTTLSGLVIDTDRQTSILPATVGYYLDLGAIGAGDLNWNPDRRELVVRRPTLRVGDPAIRWNEAETYTSKGWLPFNDDVALRLQQDNAGRAPDLFRQQARAPTLMALAEEAADAMLAATFRLPLAAAGYPDARVIVARPGPPAGPAATP